jgi:hypothetical protein
MCKCVTKQSNSKFNVSLAIPTPQFSKPLKYKTNKRNPEESYQVGIKVINTIYFFIHPKTTIYVATKLSK